MDHSLPIFSLPFVDSTNGEHILSGNLLETYEVLEQFLSTEDPIEEPDLNGPTTLHCEICRKKFDNAPSYYGHLRVHSKDKLWICDQCPDQRFSTKQQLMKHSLTHKPLERVWKCPQCPMAFETLWAQQQHLFAKHLDFRPHKCNTCQKKFQKLSDLEKHQLIHKNITPFSCSVCSRQFKDKSNLNRHMVQHTKEKHFVCSTCKKRFTQLSSMRRHSRRCPRAFLPPPPPALTRLHHCRVCGCAFQYKGALLEHCVRYHTTQIDSEADKDERSLQNAENKTVETIVDEILSVEDEYSIVNTNRMAQTDVHNFLQTDERTNDNLMHIEFLKEMNQLHTLDDELFYNDLDFDSFQHSQVFNDVDLHNQRKPEILFDFGDPGRSVDQDLMNAMCQAKVENMPDQFLIEDPTFTEATDNLLDAQDANNYCATIFESDVDLDASTSLAMNLNQLIGENNVSYMETEEGDTFIISVNSGVDTEKLTDILNIGVEMVENNESSTETGNPVELDKETEVNEVANLPLDSNLDSIVLKIPEPAPEQKDKENVVNVTSAKVKMKKKVIYVCRICNKVFNRKDNYRSHRGTHCASLRRHDCSVCGEVFSYRSTLNKHFRREHTPHVVPAHTCQLCGRQYTAHWMLNNHMERDHDLLTPYKCDEEGCRKEFYKKGDLEVHKRSHSGVRPFGCVPCTRAFTHVSHLWRHMRTVHKDTNKMEATIQKINRYPDSKKKRVNVV